MTPKEYDALVRQLSPSSPIGKDTALAFVVGGGICAVGQLIANGWQALGLTQQEAASATSVTLVFLSVLLTALGLYHRLARYAGAGTLVPITGFANAVASPAIDFRAEVRCIIGISLYVLKTSSLIGSPPDIPPHSGQPPRRPIRR